MTIDLYYTPISPPCNSVMYVANQLNIELNLKKLDLFGGEHLKPEFHSLNPAHSVPTIDDNGFVLWESRAIIQYLCNKYAPDSDLYPSEPKSRAQVDRILNFDIGSFYPSIRHVIFKKNFRGTDPTAEEVESLKKNLKLLDQFIGDNRYVAAKHLTIADLSLASNAKIFGFVGYDLSDYPNVKEWIERLPNELPYLAKLNEQAKQGFLAFMEKKKKERENK